MYELILIKYKPTGSNCLKFSDPSYFIHLLSAYSAEIELRIKIFMMQFVCGQNFVLFGHSGHKLQRFENLVFSKFIWNCRCSDNVYTAVKYSIQMYSIVKTKSLKRCNSCLESKFSQQTNLSMKISILRSISAENKDKRSMKITQIGDYVTCYEICKTVRI